MLTIDFIASRDNIGGWQRRHLDEVRSRRQPVIEAIRCWIDYATKHQRRFESNIGDDYVLGPAWAKWGAALRDLLNGDVGQADCGTLDTILCRNLTEQGFDPNDL